MAIIDLLLENRRVTGAEDKYNAVPSLETLRIKADTDGDNMVDLTVGEAACLQAISIMDAMAYNGGAV